MGAGRQDSEEDASNAADLMQSIDKATIVPDELTKYLLGTVGVDFEHDLAMLKLVSLAGQRFMRMVLHDALQVCKRRVKAEEVSAAAKAKKDAKSRRETVGAWALTSEDVSNALREYGINNNVPPFFLQNEGAWLI